MNSPSLQNCADDLYNLVWADLTRPEIRRAAIEAISKLRHAPWYPELFEDIFGGIYAYPYSMSGTLPKTMDILEGLIRYINAVNNSYPPQTHAVTVIT